MRTASGSSELSSCLFRRCLPFCFEVWHPLCYPKTRPLCQDSVKFLGSKHDVSIVQVLFCWLFICTLHVEITWGGKKIPRIGIAGSGICTFCKVVDPSCQKALWKTLPLCLLQQFKKTPVFHTLTHSRFQKYFNLRCTRFQESTSHSCFVLTPA